MDLVLFQDLLLEASFLESDASSSFRTSSGNFLDYLFEKYLASAAFEHSPSIYPNPSKWRLLATSNGCIIPWPLKFNTKSSSFIHNLGEDSHGYSSNRYLNASNRNKIMRRISFLYLVSCQWCMGVFFIHLSFPL